MTHTKQAMLEQMRGLDALRRYVEMRQTMPLNGLGDSVHHIHASTEYEAELRFSDLVSVVEQFSSLWPMLSVAQGAAQGWKLVPIEPTQEMIGAAEDAREAYAGYAFRDVYAEMVNAAPASALRSSGLPAPAPHHELADKIEAAKLALDTMDDGQPDALGPTEAAFFDLMEENTETIIAALRILPAPALHAEVREAFLQGVRQAVIEKCAKIVEGEVVHSRYREWPAASAQGNRANDSEIVRHCDRLAEAIRALALPQSTERAVPVPTIDDVPSCGQENDHRRAAPQQDRGGK